MSDDPWFSVHPEVWVWRTLCAWVELVHLYRVIRHESTAPIPHLPVLGDVCPGCFHFSREKCCPRNTGGLPDISIEFQYPTLHSIPPPCAWCTWIPRFSEFFFSPAVIRLLGSDGDLDLWNKRPSLMSKLNCRFSSVLCVVRLWLKPRLLSRLNGLLFFNVLFPKQKLPLPYLLLSSKLTVVSHPLLSSVLFSLSF